MRAFLLQYARTEPGSMSDDIIGTILRAESDYNFALEKAVEEAEKYAQDSRNDQSAYLEELRKDFHAFEKSERDKFDKTLFESLRKMDAENATLKEQLKACQSDKADAISDRLMKEVLLLYGDS